MLTRDTLKRLWPRAPRRKIDALAANANQVLRQYDISTPQRVAHFMAQVSHENGAGTIVRENMNYSADRLCEIFGLGHHSARITHDEAESLAHHGEAIAERVYGIGNPRKSVELGNTHKGDGWRYRGNGDLQLTGRTAHERVGKMIGVDLADNPEQLEDPLTSFRCAAAEFAASGCIPHADDDDCRAVTKLVNGGYNGLSERQKWLTKWKRALGAEGEAEAGAGEDDSRTAPAPVPTPPAPAPSPPTPPTDAPKEKTGISEGATAAGGLTILGILSTMWDKITNAPAAILDVIGHVATQPQFWAFAGIGIAAFYVWRQRQKQKMF